MRDRSPQADPPILIGTAGWAIPGIHRDRFPAEGSHLARYAAVFDAVEINSSFYRPHRRSTYERWADTVPQRFRFSVKLPKAITHVARLSDCREPIAAFAEQVAGLGPKLGAVLVQLPPSLAFEPAVAARFFEDLGAHVECFVAVEPRHASWSSPAAIAMLAERRIARVAADPAVIPDGGVPGGWIGGFYRRLHGSPEIYRSAYGPARLAGIARNLKADAARGGTSWCIFDNTASFAATVDALECRRLVG